MSNHLKLLTVLAAGMLLGSFATAHNAFPTATAQTTPEVKSATSQPIDQKSILAAAVNNQSSIFPETNDPGIARLYATAYIVGEALRAGIVETEKSGKLNPVDATRNLVRDVYQELRGK